MPEPITRDDILLALDAAIASLVTLRRLVEHVEDEPEVLDPADWRGPCPDRDGRAHRPVWGLALDGQEQGVCEVCGTEFTRPVLPDVVGVSGPETGAEQP